MQYASLPRRGYLPIGPVSDLIADVERGRGQTIHAFLERPVYDAHRKAARKGCISLELAEDICDQLGHHPASIYGGLWDEAVASDACAQLPLAAAVAHGDRRAYTIWGCRGAECRAAERTYQRGWRERRDARLQQQAGAGEAAA